MSRRQRTVVWSELWLNQVISFNPRLWFRRVSASRGDEKSASPFHAVEIRCTSTACQAAQDARDERYISAEAPLLPLHRCDRPDRCQCRYQHHEDRRGDSRRVAKSSLSTQGEPERDERRGLKDRRAADVADDDQPFSVSEDSYYEHVGEKFRDLPLDADESAGVDPYNSGSFDKSKSWKSTSKK